MKKSSLNSKKLSLNKLNIAKLDNLNSVKGGDILGTNSGSQNPCHTESCKVCHNQDHEAAGGV